MKIEAVIFDWAGTMVDQGSRAPVVALGQVFEQAGVPVSVEEAALPMGLPKRFHIEAMLRDARIRAAWAEARGREPRESDIDMLYDNLETVLERIVSDHAEPIAGALETVAALRARGIRIASTTGYSRRIMEHLAPASAAVGYEPDVIVCADEVPGPRPGPGMMYSVFLALGSPPARACVKVDDTPSGLAEGLGAGCWIVGVSRTGTGSAEALAKAGAHEVIGSVAHLLPAIDMIETRLAQGERP